MESELVKIEKLQSSEQCSIYKFQIRVLMNASELWNIVSSEEKLPLAADIANEANLAAAEKKWKKDDSKAQRIIVTSIGQQPMLHIMNCKTSNEMWKKLESVYEQKSKASIHLLQQKFYGFTKDPRDGMAIHISKLQQLVQQLSDLGEEVSTSTVVTKKY